MERNWMEWNWIEWNWIEYFQPNEHLPCLPYLHNFYFCFIQVSRFRFITLFHENRSCAFRLFKFPYQCITLTFHIYSPTSRSICSISLCPPQFLKSLGKSVLLTINISQEPLMVPRTSWAFIKYKVLCHF